MRFPRSSGILLHPTSLPGPYGIGELGSEAYRFVDYLVQAGQKYWQVLPLGPTGYGDSPYQCFSAFAGNPLLISLERLLEDDLLTRADLESVPDFPKTRIDYGWIIDYKIPLLHKAWKRVVANQSSPHWDAFHRFCDENNWWLHDYALFMAIKNAHKGKVWTQWERDIARHEPEAMERWHNEVGDEVGAQKFWQYLFFSQWWAVKTYCFEKGIKIIGDIPIYVAHDSADVWSRPDLYHLDEKSNPTVVAGVPPDYFSKTGQLWGNPIYRWNVMAKNGYQWWNDRFRQILTAVDIVRLDHFRGFEAYWEVPAKDKTAENGQWVKGPGAALFETLQFTLGELPIVAENLGVITEDVEQLRYRFEFPGMAILQFAFGSDAECVDLPHNYQHNTVAYSGTHDNDTTMGWWEGTAEGSTRTPAQVKQEKEFAKRYLNTDGAEMNWTFVRTLMASVADTVVFPLQDLFGLGTEARQNMPGRPAGNWQWRYTADQLTDSIAERLLELTETYGRFRVCEDE